LDLASSGYRELLRVAKGAERVVREESFAEADSLKPT
jgi:hypothetical protein